MADPARTAPVPVAVQGLGFVGAAMAIAIASAVTPEGGPAFEVWGVDLDTEGGRFRAGELAAGRFPFATTDDDLVAALAAAVERGNLHCGTDPEPYGRSEVVVVDVPLDIDWRAAEPVLHQDGFEAAIRELGRVVQPGTLVLVETTVPPGTTVKVVAPAIAEELAARGLDPEAVLVAHSPERVMPGAEYLSSIVHFWRVYAGATTAAADAAEAFLRQVIDTERFPLTRLSDPTASETAKVMENTFRATTIALMDEWARFAELVGVDLFEIVEAIRVRPTHNNIRTPGFGVGGYCLTKDPLFASIAARELWGEALPFPFSTAAVRTNDLAPISVLDRVEHLLGGSLTGRRILLAGISYRQDVGDTRYSPSETFVRAATERGATVVATDPLVPHWEELGEDLATDLPSPAGFDAVVFALPHQQYRDLDVTAWAGEARPLVVDAFDVLRPHQHAALADLGIFVASIGRGTPRDPIGGRPDEGSRDG